MYTGQHIQLTWTDKDKQFLPNYITTRDRREKILENEDLAILGE